MVPPASAPYRWHPTGAPGLRPRAVVGDCLEHHGSRMERKMLEDCALCRRPEGTGLRPSPSTEKLPSGPNAPAVQHTRGCADVEQLAPSCPGPLCIKERGKSKRVYFIFFFKKGLIDEEYKLQSRIDLLFELEPERNLSLPISSSGETTCSRCTGPQALGPLSRAHHVGKKY